MEIHEPKDIQRQEFLSSQGFTWIDIHGSSPGLESFFLLFSWRSPSGKKGYRKFLVALAEEHTLHPQVVKDCMAPNHLPKLETNSWKSRKSTLLMTRYFDNSAAKGEDRLQVNCCNWFDFFLKKSSFRNSQINSWSSSPMMPSSPSTGRICPRSRKCETNGTLRRMRNRTIFPSRTTVRCVLWRRIILRCFRFSSSAGSYREWWKPIERIASTPCCVWTNTKSPYSLTASETCWRSCTTSRGELPCSIECSSWQRRW